MATEGPGREDRPDDSDDIDARFEQIVSGLRAEQAESQQRHREAIRRAQQQRRSANRPLEGFDRPNPWPPSPRRDDQSSAEGPRDSTATPDGTNPPWSDPSAPSPQPPPGPRAADRGGEPRAPGGGGEPPHTPHQAPESAWRGWEEPDEEEHFIPPTPSLPAGDLHLWAIVVGLLGGPLLLILSEVFRVLDSGWWTTIGVLLSVGGVVLLFMRLPKHRDYTDSSGGAQV